jgi:hypothetical protein
VVLSKVAIVFSFCSIPSKIFFREKQRPWSHVSLFVGRVLLKPTSLFVGDIVGFIVVKFLVSHLADE